MRVIAKERCFLNNRIYEAGAEFDYDGPMPPKGIGPLVPANEIGGQEAAPSKPKRGRAKKGHTLPPEWTTEGHPDTGVPAE